MIAEPPAARPLRDLYAQVSSEEGLEQAFNSLDAQREACAAYILSQKHEGWTTLPRGYDDGGFSGGSMDRPGLRQLLADVEAGGIDVVVVYKVDRLTRALADFARIVAIFDAAGVSFVSVTQAFNTTSSMGRLTLNVLLSFAQFEREVTAERVRDKIAASKAKGMWMGGVVPIGYRAEARSLQPVPEEAALVRRIFARYLALGSVHRLKAELDAAGIRTPERRHRDGGRSGGAAFSRGKLYDLLANPLFIGRIRHRDQVHPGQHPPIVDEALWQAVQDRLASQPAEPQHAGHGGEAEPARRSALRSGRPEDAAEPCPPEGPALSLLRQHRSRRRQRRHGRHRLADTRARARGRRRQGRGSAAARAGLPERGSPVQPVRSEASTRLIGRISELADRLDAPASAAGREALRLLIARVELSRSELRATASFERLKETPDAASVVPALFDFPPFLVVAPLRLQRRGPELRIVLQGAAAPAPKPDPLLVRRLIEARTRVADYLDPDQGLSLSAIARRAGAQCRRRLALAAARLPGSGPGRGDPRRHPAGRPHRRATEAGRRAAAALGRAAGDARRRRTRRRRSPPAIGSR